MKSCFLAALTVVSSLAGSHAAAAAADAEQATRCQALKNADFSTTQDVPAQVTEATRVAARMGIPAYCQVQGRVTARLEFEMRLPEANWNGRLLTIGKATGEACTPYLKRGYACLPTLPPGTGNLVAREASLNLEAVRALMEDFEWRDHRLTVGAKAIVNHFYSTLPRRAYLMGCSGGGNEALTVAQSFPWDYDGIIAGDPNLDIVDWSLRVLWSVRNLQGADGRTLFSDGDLQVLHRAVLARCDRDDGVADGILGNAVGCQFDPSALVCNARADTPCLTSAQVEAVKRIYSGPTTSEGYRIANSGVLPGSELSWNAILGIADYGALYLKYAFDGAKPGIDAGHFDFDRDYRLSGRGTFDARNNPDLRKFKTAGGKLILYQSGNDISQVARGTVDYYEIAERAMGGRTATQEFLRLFVVPGANHCGGGVGASAIDYLGALEAWVEKGQAPDVMIGAHVEHPARPLEFPLDPAIPVAFTRPVYPYPLYAKYLGEGSTDDAASFGPVDPSSSTTQPARRSSLRP